MAKSPVEEKWYIVPEIEVRVHESWINLVQWCASQAPYADIEIRIVNGQPTDLLNCKPKIRFDKHTSLPQGLPVKL